MSEDLIRQLRQEVLSEAPLAGSLRKCLLLAGRSGSGGLRDWARQELDGYSTRASVPEYRVVGATIRVDILMGPNLARNMRISPAALPEWVREHVTEQYELMAGIGELEAAIAAEGSLQYALPESPRIAIQMTNLGDGLHEYINVRWDIPVVVVRGVLDKIRTRLTEFVINLEAESPGDVPPSRKVVERSFNQAFSTGDNANINIISTESSKGVRVKSRLAGSDTDGWWTAWRTAGAAIVGLATVAATVIAGITWWPWK